MKRERSTPPRSPLAGTEPRAAAKSAALGLPEITARLRRGARKITGPRQAILQAMRAGGHPLTIREIWKALPEKTCDLATVYRLMHLLAAMRLATRFDFGDGVARFEVTGGQGRGHHHHLICKRCAEVVEVEECFSRDLEERIAARSGFKSVTHSLEFFGICPSCQ